MTTDEIMALADYQMESGSIAGMHSNRVFEARAALRAAVERVIHERDDAEGAFRVWKGRTERAEAEPPLYTISRGSDGRATVTTTPAPDDAAKLPDAVIDGIAQKCWPNDEWIGVRYIQFARAVERAVIAAMKEKP